jgi:hypothetical protein
MHTEWDSAVGRASGYGLDDERVEFEYRWEQTFSLLHVVQTGSGSHPPSYPMGTEGKSGRGVKLATHLPLVPWSKKT